MKGLKIVTATEMARIEALALKSGCKQEEFVQQAGLRIAELVEQLKAKEITLLIGKGNKGADAFAAGVVLLEMGCKVQAWEFAEGNDLAKIFREKFKKRGGRFEQGVAGELIIDGLLGTGFKGKTEGVFAEGIAQANASGIPILAIDLPSGLDGNTGEVRGNAIKACATIAMGMPKIGCFLREGWNVTGELSVGDFGLSEEWIDAAQEVAFLPERGEMRMELPVIKRNRHKYQAGKVVGYAGAKEYPGAAKLASLAALRGGAGMVKLFSPPDTDLSDAPYEVIRGSWREEDWNAQSAFVGPGLIDEQWIREKVPHIKIPVVLDAGAFVKNAEIPKGAICTPHRGEMQKFFEENLEEEKLLKRTQDLSQKKQIIIILKGAPTWVFTPSKKPWIIAHGDPGMATAGSGDVLTGLIAALLAQGCSGENASLLGTMIHGLAGEIAAKRMTSYCMIARDLIDSFSDAFKTL